MMLSAKAIAQTRWEPVKGLGGGEITWLAVDSSGAVLATTRRSLYSSTSNGSSWDRVSMPSINEPYVAWAPVVVTPNGTVVMGIGGSFLSRSPSSSAWRIWHSTSFIHSMTVGPDGSVYAAASSHGSVTAGLFKSTDDGVSWSGIDMGKTNEGYQRFGHSVIVVGDGDLLYGADDGIFRSTDKGDSWKLVQRLGRMWRLFNAPSGTILTSTDGGNVYRSTDGGSTWNAFPIDTAITLVTGFASDGKGNLYAACSRGIYISADDGLNWVSIAPFYSYQAVIVTEDDVIIGGTSEGNWCSSDQGKSWSRANVGINELSVSDVTFGRPNEMWVATVTAGLLRSTDNGDTWEHTSLSHYARSVLWVNDSVLLATQAYWTAHYLLRSTDRGITWTKILEHPGFDPSHPTSVLVRDAGGRIYYGNTFGLHRSTDEGLTWDWITGVTYGSLVGMVSSILADTTGLIVIVGDRGIIRSTNYGAGWGLIDSCFYGWLARGPGGIIYRSDFARQGMFASHDGGIIWKRMSLFLAEVSEAVPMLIWEILWAGELPMKVLKGSILLLLLSLLTEV
jgi:photosystem II stability/assembly factor-like uncharacterized protein